MSKIVYRMETFKFPHINKVNKLANKFWGKNGTYNHSYYIRLIFQKLSICLIIDREFAGVCLCENLGKKRCLISLIMIDKKFQNKGFGKLLLSFCLDNLISEKYNFCILQVCTKNSKAIGLYENLKFFKIKYLSDYYIGEKDSDAFLMGRYLYKPKFDYECFSN